MANNFIQNYKENQRYSIENNILKIVHVFILEKQGKKERKKVIE